MSKKKRNRNIIIGVLVLILIGVVLSQIDVLPFAISGPAGEYIETPTFMYYECSPASQPVLSAEKIVASSGEWIKCPSNTDQCDINLYVKERTSPFPCTRRLVYERCAEGGYCGGSRTLDITVQNYHGIISILNLRQDETVWVQYQRACIPFIWTNYDKGYVQASYKPFILWKNSVFGGGRTEYTSIEQGCVFPFQDRGNLIENLVNLVIPHIDNSVSPYELEPYKTRNFVDTFVPISKENVNFVTYNLQEGYCLNRRVYSIGTVETEAHTYRVVDTNLNNVIASSVTCCPGETEPTRRCKDNFQWETIQGGECSLFNPCAGADWFPSGNPKELISYNCENGYCVQKAKIVECTTNADCVGNPKGATCDTLLWECVIAPGPVPGPGVEICDNNIDDDSDGKIDMQDEDCQEQGICEVCDDYVKSKTLGGIFPALKCKPKILQNNVFCFFSFLKLALVPIVLIFATLLGKNLFSSFKALKGKSAEPIAWLLSILVAGILAWLTFVLFWLGVLVFVAFMIFKVVKKAVIK